MRLQPDWLAELVSICAADDWASAQGELGFPQVSPMFRRMLPDVAESEVGGYSSIEVRACRAGIEWLSRQHPTEYAALAREAQPWQRRHFARADNHDELLLRAGQLLAAFVDRHVGD